MAIKFIGSIIDAFPVSPLGVHIGVVVELPANTIVIELGQYKEKPNVDAAVREIISAASDSGDGAPSGVYYIGKGRAKRVYENDSVERGEDRVQVEICVCG